MACSGLCLNLRYLLPATPFAAILATSAAYRLLRRAPAAIAGSSASSTRSCSRAGRRLDRCCCAVDLSVLDRRSRGVSPRRAARARGGARDGDRLPPTSRADGGACLVARRVGVGRHDRARLRRASNDRRAVVQPPRRGDGERAHAERRVRLRRVSGSRLRSDGSRPSPRRARARRLRHGRGDRRGGGPPRPAVVRRAHGAVAWRASAPPPMWRSASPSRAPARSRFASSAGEEAPAAR